MCVRALALSPADLAPLLAPAGRLLVFGPRPADALGWEPAAALAPGLHMLRRP